MHYRNALVAAAVAVMLTLTTYSDVDAADRMAAAKAPPGGDFKPVADLVPLPKFISGLGTLYVDPSTLPVGPYLGYDHGGKLVNITYMVPLKDMESHKNFDRLGTAVDSVEVNHTDINYNPGHSGVEEPHYHIVQWLISPQEQQKLVK